MSVSEPLVQASLLGEAIDSGPVLVFVAGDDMKYVAVNQFAADVLGYSRQELLGMSVPEVARYPDAPAEVTEMVAAGQRTGTAELVRKDGTTVGFTYRAMRTTVARMAFYVAVGWITS